MPIIDTGPAIRVRDLTKSYGDVRVLDGLDLDVERGTIVALLGSNGAGKTTAVRILSTLLRGWSWLYSTTFCPAKIPRNAPSAMSLAQCSSR